MVHVRYGGKNGREFPLSPGDDLVVVRSRSRSPLEMVPMQARGRSVFRKMDVISHFETAGVQVLRARDIAAEEARNWLKAEDGVEFAGRALVDPVSRRPVVYTENIFIKFHNDVSADEYLTFFRLRDNLKIIRAAGYAPNAFYLGAAKGIGQDVFSLAAELLDREEVELCHPELVREKSTKQVFPQQWHLGPAHINGQAVNAHASVVGAWSVTRGERTTIAVIDDGVDTSHPEFSRRRKVVHPFDVTLRTPGALPRYPDESHGTACAGVACADGILGASGVAPMANLMPIRLASGLGSFAEADAFGRAWRNGADVISCSWGPSDGEWWNPNDPAHNAVVPLPDSTRLAIGEAVSRGRQGKGCVVTFAAGNGNESVDNDGYAANPDVLAVAACNDMGTRSAYSDFGEAVWCCFPSSNGEPSLTSGIWTTDRTGGAGYNPGGNIRHGDIDGLFTNSFGGTSSACPGVAGLAALILSANPALRGADVKTILKETADKIDSGGGSYDSNGHSPHYGYGRVNAMNAVLMARQF